MHSQRSNSILWYQSEKCWDYTPSKCTATCTAVLVNMSLFSQEFHSTPLLSFPLLPFLWNFSLATPVNSELFLPAFPSSTFLQLQYFPQLLFCLERPFTPLSLAIYKTELSAKLTFSHNTNNTTHQTLSLYQNIPLTKGTLSIFQSLSPISGNFVSELSISSITNKCLNTLLLRKRAVLQ